MISDLQHQFRMFMADIGFANSDAQNRNQHNLKLVVATVNAGIYPDIAHIHTITAAKDGQAGKYALYGKDRSRVFIHPSSILKQAKAFESKWLAFTEKVMTSRLYVRNCTIASPLSILLFGGAFTASRERTVLIVDGWIAFNANERVAVLLQALRRHLDWIFQTKIENPAADFSQDPLLNIVVKCLITEKMLPI